MNANKFDEMLETWEAGRSLDEQLAGAPMPAELIAHIEEDCTRKRIEEEARAREFERINNLLGLVAVKP